MKKLLWLCLLFSGQGHCQPTRLSAGNYKPGFISLTQFDTTRPPVAEQVLKTRGRIIQVNIWYPSKGNRQRMCFSDYVELIGSELGVTPGENIKQKGLEKYFEWPASMGADKRKFTDFLHKKIPTLAFKNAAWLEGKFPLVLLVHGFAADHSYLGEYLASHGYVVLQVPVKGSEKYELDYEGQGLQAQVLDFEFALHLLRKKFPYLTEDIAVVGFSFGGQSAIALSLRNKRIKAVVSLDGGIGSSFGAQLLSKQTYYRRELVEKPLLHFYNPADEHMTLDWFYQIPKSYRLLIGMRKMQHGHFTSFGLLNKLLPGILGNSGPDPGEGYEAVMFLTKNFLAQHLPGNPAVERKFYEKQMRNNSWVKACVENIKEMLAES